MNPKRNKLYLTKKNHLITSIYFILLTINLIDLPRKVQANNKSNHLAANPNQQVDLKKNIKSWFDSYDQIRRQAQLPPNERQNADQIMSRGLSIFMPGPDKAIAQQLLTNLVNRYETAAQQLSTLNVIPATEQLQRGYYQYFLSAKNLFSDYLKLQNDLMAMDTNSGQPVASGLVERKESLALLDQNNKTLDEQLRQQYNIPSYQYQPAPQN